MLYDHARRIQAAAAATQDIRRQLERKAAKCIQIAEVLLPGASAPVLEEQALELMDLPGATLDSTLCRVLEAHRIEEKQ